jgi:hypothetical protein
VIQLDQEVVSAIAQQKAWYNVETPANSSGEQRIAISKVVYQPRRHAITLMISKRLNVRGNVLLTVNAEGIVNLLDQHLEGENTFHGNLGTRTG